jgi:transcriptional antiterminator RfaH
MPWRVVRTRPLKEQHAASVLELRGIETFLPKLRKRTARAGRRDWEPLFPCYLFVCLEIPSQEYLMARSAPDVVYFLGGGDPTASLSDDFVSALKDRLDRANGRKAPPRFQAGERLLITEGPLQYVEAVFDQTLSPAGRSRVLVQMLSRTVCVDLPEDHLKKVV